jgi:peptide/nickel transport system permease protein
MNIKRLFKSKNLVAGLFLTIVVLLVVLFGPLVYRVDPSEQFEGKRNLPPQLLKGESPDTRFILGTDSLGRDIAVRLMYGGRLSLFISLVSVCIALAIGLLIGLIAGFFGGWVDSVLMRLTDIQLSIPVLLLAITIVAVLGPNITNLIIVLGLTRWISWARVVRANVMQIKELEYIKAARAIGASSFVIIRRHILPNVITPIIIISSQMIGFFILMEAALSFLGLGVQPPDPSWGAMISDGRNYILVAPWSALAPGLALMVTVLAVNILGDGLRDILDPRLKNV